MDALNKHRGKGQQKVTVEHVHVSHGGQAIVGNITQGGGGHGEKSEVQPHAMHLSRRCGAKTRKGTPCKAPAMANGRCRMHGGTSPGAPKGNKNALKHGLYTREAILKRKKLNALLKASRKLLCEMG